MTGDARGNDCRRTNEVAVSTRALGPREGHDVWATALDSTYCEMDLEWRDSSREFVGELTGRQFGDLFVTTVTADPHVVNRTPAKIHSDGRDDYLLCVVTSGHVAVHQDGRSSTLGDGAFAILDPLRPFVFRSETPFSQVVIKTPRDLLDSRIALRGGSALTARAVSATGGAGRLVSGFLQSIASVQPDSADGVSASLSASTLDMLVTSLNAGLVHPSRRARVRARDLRSVQAHLESTLHDPDVSLADAARAAGMSLRYVQNLFRDNGTTPSAWLGALRLERARRLLMESTRTVQEVSEASGFRDVSHFSRTFRRCFGESPGRYRDLRVSQALSSSIARPQYASGSSHRSC